MPHHANPETPPPQQTSEPEQSDGKAPLLERVVETVYEKVKDQAIVQNMRQVSAKYVERFTLQRKIIAHMMQESWKQIPATSVVYEPDVTEFWQAFQRLKKKPEWAGITVNMLLTYICTIGMLAAPQLNAHLNYHHSILKGKLKLFDEVHLSCPTIMPDGRMMALTHHNCERKTLRQIREYYVDLRRRIQQTHLQEMMIEVALEDTRVLFKRLKWITICKRLVGFMAELSTTKRLKQSERRKYLKQSCNERLTKDDIMPGTVMFSNIGSIYRGSYNVCTMLEILPPMVGAVCIGNFQEKPGVVRQPDGSKTVEPRMVLPVGITMDHRALDYDGVVPFCKKLDEVFAAAPTQMEQWLSQPPKAWVE